jgi:HEPN domain-containing protein
MADSRLIEIVQQWVMKAENDLEIVRRDITSEKPVTDVLCFHCQQAVEKYLKAFLVYHGIKPPRVHIIENILSDCEKIDLSFKSLRHTMYMSEFSVELRYPDDFYLPPPAQLEKAFRDAVDVRNFVRSKLPEIQ